MTYQGCHIVRVNPTVTDGGVTMLHHKAIVSGLLLPVVALVFVLDLLVIYGSSNCRC